PMKRVRSTRTSCSAILTTRTCARNCRRLRRRRRPAAEKWPSWRIGCPKCGAGRKVMFREILRSIAERVEGTLAVSLIGLDGIAVETVSFDSLPLDAMGAEFGGFIKSVRVTNTELDTGDVLQFSLVTEKYIAFLSAR